MKFWLWAREIVWGLRHLPYKRLTLVRSLALFGPLSTPNSDTQPSTELEISLEHHWVLAQILE